MEPLFINHYQADFRMLAEFGRKHAIGPRPWTFVFAPFVVIFSLYYMSMGDYHLGIAWFVMLTLYAMPYYYAWMAIRASKQLNDGMVPPATISFGDTIELEEGVTRLTVHYRNIRRVVRLKRSYVLLTSRRTGVMIREDGFTKGTFPEFKQFLREKRPDLNIPE